MGQEQSADTPASAPHIPAGPSSDRGVTLVRGTGTGIQTNTVSSEADQLLAKSASLPLPQPLLPPPAVEDNITSALQGAKMMQELRTLFDGMMLNVDETSSSLQDVIGLSSSSPSSSHPDRQIEIARSGLQDGSVDKTKENENQSSSNGVLLEHDGKPMTSPSADEKSNSDKDQNQFEHEAWDRIGINASTLDKVVSDCTGGERMTSLVRKQTQLLQKIREIEQLASQLKSVVEKSKEQARQTTKAIDILDRLSLTISDLSDSLDNVTATANILGAAHFADNDEMCSFKQYLNHNPPKYSESTDAL